MRKHFIPLFFLSACLVVSGSVLHAPVIPPAAPDTTEKAKPDTPREVIQAATDSSNDNGTSTSSEEDSATPRQATEEKEIVTEAGDKFPLRTYKALATPNDPAYSQWWVSNIDLASSWDVPAGDDQTLLAIIDTGFALNHQEFTDRWFINSGEHGPASSEGPSDLNCTDQSLPLTEACNNIDDDGDGINDNESAIATTIENPSRLNCTDQNKTLTKDCNLIDDDDNGLVDDWRGWDFINYDGSVQAGEMNPDGEGTHHGTYVAGAAAATGDNGVGMAGVDWHTKILPLQALDDDSYGHTLSVARSVRYATAMGADVISISLGSDLPDSYLRTAIQEAVSAGIIVVAASGNDDCACLLYPAAYPEVVAVGASDSSNQRASFSNYGATLDVVAPGTSIYTTDWGKFNGVSAYSSVSGTSISTPIVSGLLTRMRSHQPTATAQQLIAALSENNDRITLASNQHRTNSVGYGKINALSALQRATTTAEHRNATEFAQTNQGQGYELLSVQARMYDCGVDNVRGTTPLYELVKGSSAVYTVSEVERAALVSDGYTSSLFSYVCLNLPADTFNEARTINVFQEFRNDPNKD